MSFPDSSNVGPVFIQDLPDFNKPLSVAQRFRTTAFIARVGDEQRARRRQRPRYSMSYVLSALDLAAFVTRRANSLIELGAPLVVPIWTHPLTLSSMTTVNTAEFLIPLSRKKFKKTSWAYFVQAGKVSTFRLITTINNTSLSLHASQAYPIGAIPAFTVGAQVYPCIVGRRTDDSTSFTLSRINQTDEEISIEEL